LAALTILAVLTGCVALSGDWVERARFEAEPMQVPDDLGPPGCVRLDSDHGDRGDLTGPDGPVEPVTPDLGTGNDPYTGAGARQLPGPFMTHQQLPDEPASTLVVRPQDPDEHVAARNQDGEVTGPVPPPKVISTVPPPADGPVPAGTASPGTTVPDAAPTCIPGPPL
jgi:hypothetical protein